MSHQSKAAIYITTLNYLPVSPVIDNLAMQCVNKPYIIHLAPIMNVFQAQLHRVKMGQHKTIE